MPSHWRLSHPAARIIFQAFGEKFLKTDRIDQYYPSMACHSGLYRAGDSRPRNISVIPENRPGLSYPEQMPIERFRSPLHFAIWLRYPAI